MGGLVKRHKIAASKCRVVRLVKTSPDYEVVSALPTELSAEEIGGFVKLVEKGGEVNANGLEARIKAAWVLLRVMDDGTLCAVGALKQPNQIYRNAVFAKAQSPLTASEFERELGWIYVVESHRQRGLARQLVSCALAAAADNKIFATSRTDNLGMHKALATSGFTLSGNEFPSEQDPTKALRLLCR